MPVDKWDTVGARLHWVYANLAMAHAAVSDGSATYGRIHYIVRTRLFSGLRRGTMRPGPFLDDERLKLQLPKACCYCGVSGQLTLDHLVSRARGGGDESDNIIWSCRRCNSSKGPKDLLVWMGQRGEFPALLLLRRYLKLGIVWCEEQSLMEHPVAGLDSQGRPFALEHLPRYFPEPSTLRLWVTELPRDA